MNRFASPGGVKVFLPNFRLWMVRPSKPLAPNQVVFRTTPDVNKLEIKEYLEKVYQVPVSEVHTQNVLGKLKRTRFRGVMNKRPDFKLAYVTLKDSTFSFPDLFPKADKDGDSKK
eukprot:m.47975 g.47975  ORF g.47975 m.47975 type:complete len:115 (-) comp14911_c0_seq1:32-376(-)